MADYEASLTAGKRHRSRMLLRLLTSLTVVNVLHASDVLELLEAVVQSAVSIAEAGVSPDG